MSVSIMLWETASASLLRILDKNHEINEIHDKTAGFRNLVHTALVLHYSSNMVVSYVFAI